MIKLCFCQGWSWLESSLWSNVSINKYSRWKYYLSYRKFFCPMKHICFTPRPLFLTLLFWSSTEPISGINPVHSALIDSQSSSLWFSTTAAFRCCRKSFRFWGDGRWTRGVTSSGGWDRNICWTEGKWDQVWNKNDHKCL